MFDKVSNEVAGTTRFYDTSSSYQSTRIGYTWYGKKYRGTLLNKSCKYLLFDFAFNEIGFERIGLGAYIENKRSIAAMQSVGCVKEGILRGLLPATDGNGRTDAILFSMLKDEWNNTLKHRLKNKLETHL